jgi:ubiquinone/menaquinone biosynthesis C-methylase UbiE
LLALVLDSERENPLFRAPVGKNPEHILDIGTGKGNWAVYVRRDPLLFPQQTKLIPI